MAARPPRGGGGPPRDAAPQAHRGAPDGRPGRARLLQQPAGQRRRPGRGAPQGGDAAAGLARGAGWRTRSRSRRAAPWPWIGVCSPGASPRRWRPCPGCGSTAARWRRSPRTRVTILATGPLTSDALAAELAAFVGQEHLHFFDAVSPVVEADTIDFDRAFRASRYDKGGDDYVNCALDEDEYQRVLRRPRLRRVRHHPRLREGAVLRGVPPHRGHRRRGASTPCASAR